MIEGLNAYEIFLHEKKLSIERRLRQGRLASEDQIAEARRVLREESEANMPAWRKAKLAAERAEP